MDVYMNSGESLSLQEMLDIDYKTGLDGIFPSMDFGLSLTGDLSPLDLEDAFGDPGTPRNMPEDEEDLVDMTAWFTNNGLSTNNNSNSSYTLDLVNGDIATMMVNTNSVMPVTVVTVPSSSTNSNNNTYITSSGVHSSDEDLTFSSPSPSANSVVDNSSSGGGITFVRTLSASSGISTASTVSSPTQARSPVVKTQPQASVASGVRIAAATSTSHTLRADATSSGLPSILATAPRTVPIVTSSTKITQQQRPITRGQVTTESPVRTRTIHVQQAQPSHFKRQHIYNSNKHYSDFDMDDKAYPKPAYSYSCLIAMALKNSKTGSLPVSEIYNFMCEHFPYFKTAPNGWKNSVRHNLSLNKCFEKIEKPSGNGSHQRKGCLWAMNPAKIAKMDEEVQKWSKKDPMAIKKAMLNPENLEMLERGEMKREYVGLLNNGMVHSPSGTDESDDMEVPDIGDVSENVEIICSDPATPLSPTSVHLPEFIDIATVADELEDASLNDFDIEVTDEMYEDLEVEDEQLNLGVTLTPSSQSADLLTSTTLTLPVITSSQVQTIEYIPPVKRGCVAGNTTSIQGNYLYKPVVSANSSSSSSVSRRKAPILLRASSGASSLIKIKDP
ncbi:Fork head domain transcription factor slp1 [Gryllus bimaculatus]|nr:Fork head domain transcription factor slp1 [Gryllus bimaculatus]